MATEAIVAPTPLAEVPAPDANKNKVDIKIEEAAEEKPADLGFDPVALKQKYLDERDKRLNASKGQGTDQYKIIEGPALEHYLVDPWVEPGFTRDPVEEEVDVVIIGGGYGAQSVCVRLLEAGIKNFKIIEKAGDFGGTWYWNRYPGAQCDIESYIYMPLLEEVGYMPTEKYARAKELLRHSRIIGEKFGLYDKALFQTEVKEMRWDDATAMWTTSTSRGDKIRSRFVIPAAGPLHRPKLPGLEGIEDFKGHSFHSSRWDFNYTGGDPSGGLEKLKDKRVGIIGTGATAVQIVPHLGEWAKQLYVFQRTPSSIDVRANRPTDPEWAAKLEPGWQKKRMDNFDSVVNGGIEPEDMVADRWTDILRGLMAKFAHMAAAGTLTPEEIAMQRQIADFEKMNQIRARCDEIVKDKATADALKPWYNQFCKRPCFHDEYLQTFNRPNVKLVDTRGQGVDRITEKGVVANGEEYELDCLIYATGFELATDWTHRTGFEIYGRDGLTITEKWKEGAQTLHGWTTRGFPNCFIVQVVQATLTPNFMHVTGEQARHFAYVISEVLKRKIRTVEPTTEAELEWTDVIVEGTKLRGDFFKECTPGYYNNEGKPTKFGAKNAQYAHGSPAFLKILREWRAAGDMKGLDIQYLEEQKPTANGTAAATQAPATNGVPEEKPQEKGSINEETKAATLPPTGANRPLAQKYTDLQAKHQAEVSDLLRKHSEEVARLLKSES